MSDLIFVWLWAIILLVPQQAFRVSLGPLALEFDFVTLLVIYLGFSSSFWKGLVSVIIISLIAEALSFAPLGLIVLSNLIIYVILQLLIDQILTEAYLTKMFWVLMASFTQHILTGLVLDKGGNLFGSLFFWSMSTANSMGAALLSFPLFIILDGTRGKWESLFSKQKAQITGADFFAVKSGQRKYLG